MKRMQKLATLLLALVMALTVVAVAAPKAQAVEMGVGNAKTATFAKKQVAKITTQPKNVAVSKGNTAKVTVKATGDGLKYQWYYKNKGASKFTLSSKTGSSYAVTMDSARDGRQVYCKITDKYGNTVTTKTVTLSIKRVAKITTQPKNVNVTKGNTAKVTVKATGDGLKYQWYYKNDGANKFTLSSKTGSSYVVTMDSARDGRKVYCKITDKYGNTVTTKTVTLSMKKLAKITAQPKNVTVSKGSTAKVTVKATGDGLKYQWYYKNKGASKFTLSSKTGSSYAVTMDSARDGRKVYCKITDKYGNIVTTKTVTMSMKKTSATEPVEPSSDVLIISDTQIINGETINSDVYITSTGIATFMNVTVNGNVYCYGQLSCYGCVFNNLNAYAYGSMFSCGAYDGVHGKVSGSLSCQNLSILNGALDYAFNKWGKR